MPEAGQDSPDFTARNESGGEVRSSLANRAAAALATPDPWAKTARVRSLAAAWQEGAISRVGMSNPPDRPARPDRPELRPPREMARRGRGRSRAGRVALLHAVAHIELNAVDLACDLLARFTDERLPQAFYDDWVAVADDEARHFNLLADRLAEFDAAYGDLPAHDGLWQAAADTAHDLLARLAVVPLVLEARGLDVTPPMIANLRRAGDDESAAVLEVILGEEVGHVAAGRRWFEFLCARRGLEPVAAYHSLVRRYFHGALKPPFNDDARGRAGFAAAYYTPLAAG